MGGNAPPDMVFTGKWVRMNGYGSNLLCMFLDMGLCEFRRVLPVFVCVRVRCPAPWRGHKCSPAPLTQHAQYALRTADYQSGSGGSCVAAEAVAPSKGASCC